METVLVIGATSLIVQETLNHFANNGANLILVGRQLESLVRISNDLKVRGAKTVDVIVNELSNQDSPQKLFSVISSELKNQITTIYIGYGSLPDNEKAISEYTIRTDAMQVNFTSCMEHILFWFNYFKDNNLKDRKIAVISSVAGLRGRRTNVVYGASKAALNSLLSGLRSYGTTCGINVITILPGFVDTPMTSHIKKGALFASAKYVGKIIFNGIKSNKDVIYVPWFWRIIMGIILHLPEFIFKKLKF
jgi:decaprenylphospho-beta-D-erythro-pentofuranosid-2-ulose 2-reductase